jgi:hypothetical protein
MKIILCLLSLIVFFNAKFLYSQNLDKYLLLNYSFDDKNCNDISGNGYDGTPVNSPTYVDDGILGKAIHFEGKGDRISDSSPVSGIGSHVLIPYFDLVKNSEFTISLWVRQFSMSYIMGEFYIFFGDHIDGWCGIFQGTYQAPDLTQRVMFGVGGKQWDKNINEIYNNTNIGKWTHYALTFKSGIIKGYIDGRFINQIYQPINVFGKKAALARHWWDYGTIETSARFSGDMDEVKIYSKALTDEEIKNEFNKCNSWVEYPRFTNAGGLSFSGNSQIVSQKVKLTGNSEFEAGSLWSIRPIPVNDNFTSEFSFSMTEGINEGNHDGSYPGADGIAFVIQDRGYEALGDVGGGIGYDNLDNGIAIEFDTFRNEYDYYKDSTGNHVALQVSSGGKLRAKHSPDYTKAINHNIFEMKNFETYYSRVEYDYAKKELKVYLDKQLPCDTLVIDYAPLDLPKILNTNKDLAYFGFTAATGISRENHHVLSWNLCSNALPSGVEESENAEEISALSPNPAVESIEIQLEESDLAVQSIEIYDFLGIKVNEFKGNEMQINKNSIKLTVVGLPKGVYFIKITSSSKNYFGKFIKI